MRYVFINLEQNLNFNRFCEVLDFVKSFLSLAFLYSKFCITINLGTCAGKLINGNVENTQQILDPAVAKKGYILLCSSYPKSDAVIVTGVHDEIYEQYAEKKATIGLY